MQELSNGIRQVTEDPLEGKLMDPEKYLRDTAKKWAAYVIEHHNNEALKKGLEISRSIADYLNEVERVEA